MSSKIHIKKISSTEAYDIRHPVLRPGLPVESCRFEGDDLTSTIHLGAYDSKVLVGVLTLMPNPNYSVMEYPNMQLRGMGVSAHHQHKGIGRNLVFEAERITKHLHISLMWMNARILAVPFYEKMGYKKQGNIFHIPTAGDHFLMSKKL